MRTFNGVLTLYIIILTRSSNKTCDLIAQLFPVLYALVPGPRATIAAQAFVWSYDAFSRPYGSCRIRIDNNWTFNCGYYHGRMMLTCCYLAGVICRSRYRLWFTVVQL